MVLAADVGSAVREDDPRSGPVTRPLLLLELIELFAKLLGFAL